MNPAQPVSSIFTLFPQIIHKILIYLYTYIKTNIHKYKYLIYKIVFFTDILFLKFL